jgi:preprotein translocase subunit SecF
MDIAETLVKLDTERRQIKNKKQNSKQQTNKQSKQTQQNKNNKAKNNKTQKTKTMSYKDPTKKTGGEYMCSKGKQVLFLSNVSIWLYIYIRLKIKPNSVRIRF